VESSYWVLEEGEGVSFWLCVDTCNRIGAGEMVD